ncbi:MAG: hypothetical protein ABIS39_00970 [Sphingomicrobium sp.]
MTDQSTDQSTGSRQARHGPAQADEIERLGIVRVPAHTFLWNGDRYTNAADAIAAANRSTLS